MDRRHASRKIEQILSRLDAHYPQAETALTHSGPLQLLVATILSAQCTDARVNLVTPALFLKYPNARAFARARLSDLEGMIRTTGFFRSKARNIRACCRLLMERHEGTVPASLDELVKLPGVGRKTANVVLGNAFGIPGITVDTHVGRVSRRLGLSRQQDPVKVEFDLMGIVPRPRWSTFSLQLILHGRQVCAARRPRCEECFLRDLCPFPARVVREKSAPRSRLRSPGSARKRRAGSRRSAGSGRIPSVPET